MARSSNSPTTQPANAPLARTALSGTRTMVGFYTPPNERLMRELGKLVVSHGHLEHILRMTYKTLAGISLERARMDKSTAGMLRDRVSDMSEKTLASTGLAKSELIALLDRAKVVTDNRNIVIHGIWAMALDHEPCILKEDAVYQLPSVDELESWHIEATAIYHALNASRLKGSINDELKAAHAAPEQDGGRR